MRKVVLAVMLLFTMAFADKALDDELVANVCDINKVKELIAKGADKNVIFKDKYSFVKTSLYAYAAMNSNCGESAHYLSSIGAIDVGLGESLGGGYQEGLLPSFIFAPLT
ncbi:MAG: hypothetical protein LBJ88_02840 [Campylobacteraceae bacterium]|jgi:hypothetical protein|nr:hypothetical protein [Campylobacteraceae bacterium]